MDTNAAQFARAGNPWISERERVEFSAPNKKERRQNRNPKVGKFPKTPVPAPSPRDASPAFRELRRSQDFANRFAAAMGGTRTVKAAERPAEPFVRILAPRRDVELDPWHPDRLADEQRQLAAKAAQAKREVQNAKLSQLEEALRAYEKKAKKHFA